MWLTLSLFSAVASGLQNAYYKNAHIQISPVLVTWCVLVISSIFFSPLLLFGIPHLGHGFWASVVSRLILDSVAFTLYVKALQMSPLSLTVPMLSIQTLLVFLTQYAINGLVPSALGVIGVIITVASVYFLHFDHDTKHLLSPFRAIFREKGVLLMVIVSVLWSIVTALQKLSIDASNAYFYTAFFQILWAICFTPVAFLSDRAGFIKLFRPQMIRRLFPLGLYDALQVLPRYVAMTMALPVYVSAASSVSIIFSSLFGWYFYKERLDNHLIPTIFIVIGVAIITLAGAR